MEYYELETELEYKEDWFQKPRNPIIVRDNEQEQIQEFTKQVEEQQASADAPSSFAGIGERINNRRA